MIETMDWAAVTDEQLHEAGNFRGRVEGPVRSGGYGVIWEGLCSGWAETAGGSLAVRRQLLIHDMMCLFDTVVFAAGYWTRYEQLGIGFDGEQLRQNAVERDRMNGAAALGIPGISRGPGPT